MKLKFAFLALGGFLGSTSVVLASGLELNVDLNPTQRPFEIASRLVGKQAKVVKTTGKTTFTFRLNEPDDLDSFLERLKSDRSVKNVQVLSPTVDADNFANLPVTELQRRVEEYKDAYHVYQEYLEETGKAKPRAGTEAENEADEIPGLDYLEAYLQRKKLRAYPNEEIDYSGYIDLAKRRQSLNLEGLSVRESKRGLNLSSSSFDGGRLGNGAQWEFLGPRNLDVPYRIYYGIRPTSGRVNAITYDPVNTSTRYLGGAQGGVWKTTDGGVNWAPLTDAWPLLSVSSIAVSPQDPNIVLVGTGDYQGGDKNGIGIYRSTDGGATWTPTGATIGSAAISDIKFDPDTPSVVYATSGQFANGYIWKSTDSGQTWFQALSTAGNYADLSIGVPNGSGVRAIWAVGRGNDQVYKSTNQGATWTQVAVSQLSGSQGSMSLSCSTVDPNTVYLMSSNQQLILKTVDGGANWTNLTSAFNAAQNSYNWSQSWYDYHVHTSSRLINGVPTDVVYIGLIDVMMSDDAGTSWRSVGGVNNNPTYSNSAILHNDQHSFAINPQNPLEVMAGNDGGVYSGVYNAGTRNVDWTPLSKTLGITQFYTFAMFPSNKDYIMGGTQDNASPHSFADLQNWDNVTGGDGGGCVIDYNNINLQYGESQYHGLVKTSNHWNSSTSFAPSFSGQSVPFIGDMWIDPNNPDYIYVNTNYLDRYQNSTNTWSYLSNSSGTPLMSSGIVNAVAIPVGDSTRIYAGGTSGQLWMSTNFGTSWVRIDDMGGANGLPNKGITSISLDPNNKNSLLVSYSGGGTNHLYRCLDVNAASRVWTNVSGSGSNALPSVSLNSVVRDPFEPLTVWYAGTDVGVFQTLDGGANWTDITVPRGLPNVEVSKLYMNTQFNLLYASTYGRGMWRIAVDSGLAQSLDATPSVVTQGDIVNFTLHLTRPVTSNTVFTLTQSNGSALSIPATVTVTTGNDSVSFSGTAQTLASTVVDTVTATDSTGSHASANVEVRALVVDYANAVTFTNASSIVGTVNDLHVSDDVYQSWRFAVANQNGSIAEYTGHCDVQNPLKLTVRIEEAGDYTTLQREVALYDFQAGSYVVLGGNFLTTTDLTRDFVAGGSIARFLDANGNFKLRYSVVRPRNIRGFGNRIDLLEFRFQ